MIANDRESIGDEMGIYSVDDEDQLSAEDTLMGDGDPLDRGYAPADRLQGAVAFGITAPLGSTTVICRVPVRGACAKTGDSGTVVAKSVMRAMSIARSLSLPSQVTTSPHGVSSSQATTWSMPGTGSRREYP